MTRRIGVALVVAVLALGVIASAVDGPLTPLMTLATRTDANGYLIVSSGTYSGADGPLTPMANLRGRTDANGYLIVTSGGGGGFATLGANTFTDLQTITPADGTGAISITQTDSGATSQAFIKENITRSGAGEWYFAQFQAGGTDVFTMDRSGNSTWSTSGATLTLPASGVLAIGSAGSMNLTAPVMVRTAPTVSSGFGTSPSIASNNGTAAFTVNVGTGGTATSGVIGLPTATTGWVCDCLDVTTQSSTVFYCKQKAGTTTTATIANYNTAGAEAAWVASDIVRVKCSAY